MEDLMLNQKDSLNSVIRSLNNNLETIFKKELENVRNSNGPHDFIKTNESGEHLLKQAEKLLVTSEELVKSAQDRLLILRQQEGEGYEEKPIEEYLTTEEKDRILKQVKDFLSNLKDNDQIISLKLEETDISLTYLKQLAYKQPDALIVPTGKTVYTPFRKDYTQSQLEDKIVQIIKLGNSKGTPVKNKVILNKLNENLTEFQLDILSAYFTEKKENPQAQGVTFLDLANDIYHSKNGKKLKSEDKIVKQVEEEARRLIHTPFIIDFHEELQRVIDDKNHSRARDNMRAEIQQYLDNGGKGVIEANYIQGVIIPIKKANGVVLDGIAFGDRDPLADYIELTRQHKRIPELLATNPLRASEINISFHNYFSYKLTQLPYDDSNKFINIKLELLKRKKEGTLEDIKNTPEYKQAFEKQKKLLATQSHELTIRVDTIIRDLKLKIQKTRLTHNKIEVELDYLKDVAKIIEDYRINYSANNRSVESYTICFF